MIENKQTVTPQVILFQILPTVNTIAFLQNTPYANRQQKKTMQLSESTASIGNTLLPWCISRRSCCILQHLHSTRTSNVVEHRLNETDSVAKKRIGPTNFLRL